MSEQVYPKERNLDGVYYRVKRDGKWCNRCYTDLTEAEQNEFMSRLDEEGLKRLCSFLSNTLRNMADQMNIIRGTEE